MWIIYHVFCDFGISSTFDAVLRYLPIFFAVLRYLSIFSAVLRCSAPPNVPLNNEWPHKKVMAFHTQGFLGGVFKWWWAIFLPSISWKTLQIRQEQGWMNRPRNRNHFLIIHLIKERLRTILPNKVNLTIFVFNSGAKIKYLVTTPFVARLFPTTLIHVLVCNRKKHEHRKKCPWKAKSSRY